MELAGFRGGLTGIRRQQAAIKKQLQLAYTKARLALLWRGILVVNANVVDGFAEQGKEDFRKEMEAKQPGGEADPVKLARAAKEQEARENARVAALIAEINQKKYRAPINDVQCSPERDACLQCYRDQQGNVLACKEVADAFARCAQLHTEVRGASGVGMGRG